MHDIIVDEYERHVTEGASPAFYAHLENCPECRAEVAAMDNVSLLIRELSSDSETAPQPTLGFYHRVTRAIIDHEQKEAWGLFSPGAAFFRRIAFVSLLLLAGLGSVLVTRESSEGGTDAAAIMAQQDSTGPHARTDNRDRLLVTLATYRE